MLRRLARVVKYLSRMACATPIGISSAFYRQEQDVRQAEALCDCTLDAHGWLSTNITHLRRGYSGASTRH